MFISEVLCRAILRYGVFHYEDLDQLGKAYLDEKARQQENRRGSSQQSAPQRAPGVSEMRRKAVQARKRYRNAVKLRRRLGEKLGEEDLTMSQYRELRRLESGQLWQHMVACNKEYGHGIGAHADETSTELRVTLAAFSSELDVYFASD